MLSQIITFGLTGALVSARDITFPPVAAVQYPMVADVPGMSDDISQAIYAGLTTFANLPYVHCLQNGGEVEKYDVAILGAPFDTGTTGRPGARFGPSGIRQGSRRMKPQFSFDVYTGKNPFMQGLKIIDCGDVPLTFLDNTVALRQLDRAHEVISARATNDSTYSVPRLITLGGDHTTTLPALRSTFKHFGQVSVIHFDSHLDTWDPEVLGGGLSHYAGVNHGTFLHLAHEEGLISNSSIHAGIRAPVSNAKYDLKNDKACGFHILKARDLDRLGMAGFIEKLLERTAGTKVYISVDIDVLDPAYAPATGTSVSLDLKRVYAAELPPFNRAKIEQTEEPAAGSRGSGWYQRSYRTLRSDIPKDMLTFLKEPGGFTTRELLTILDGLSGIEIIGADVVEVAPVYDNSGETTGLAAAEVVRSLIQLMADTPVKTLEAVKA